VQGDLGQADLASVGMATEHRIEIGVGRLAVGLRRMGKQDRYGVVGNEVGGLLQVIHTVVMRIVDTRDVEACPVIRSTTIASFCSIRIPRSSSRGTIFMVS